MNLYQIFADFFQQLSSGRLVVDEDFSFAVAGQAALYQKFVIGLDFIFIQQGAQGWRLFLQTELGGNAQFVFPLPYQRGFGPVAQHQSERIQQNGFAGAGFAGQHA